MCTSIRRWIALWKGRQEVSRQRKSSPAEDLVDLVALLPWWAGVLSAAIMYLVLHSIASKPIATAVQPGQVGALVGQSLWKGLATAGQYVLPPICLIGAGISAWRRSHRIKLVDNVARSGAAQALDGMSWREFEMLVGEAFRLQGFRLQGFF